MDSSSSSITPSRIVYMDVLRVFSALMIICVHVSAQNWDNISVASSQWQIMNFYDCISILGVPLFYMISGAIFLNPNYSISFKKLFCNKVLRLFIIYHIWLLFYNSLPFITGELLITNLEAVKSELLYKTLIGHGIYHLWFLPELIILYIVSPILREAFQKKHISEYFLILYTITGTILPTFFVFDFPFRTIVQSYYDRTSLVMLTGYVGYFVLGHYLHTHISQPISSKTLKILSLIAILCMSIVIFVCGFDAIAKDKSSTLLNNPLMIPHFIACSCIYLIVKNISWEKKKLTHIFSALSKYTMGIYLLHPFIIRILVEIGISTLFIHPLIMIPIFTLMVFILCLAIIRLLSFIPWVNKWLL